ncbi:MAG TPA: DUF933 domain-containing protein [Candidatus Paceibacterota bacterium]|nr:DUF933 domain-containing protein [Candidatus Paceibacterota bacterium]
MKICAFGLADLPLGKHNLKDSRLDKAHELVEAKKKAYAQVDLVGEDESLEADAILVHRDRFPDLILHDLEFVETRLGRNPPDAERVVLEKIRTELESERTMFKAGLGKEELEAVAAHSFHTHKPVIVADASDLERPDALMLRAFAEGGWISFLTVGGKENRAWPVRLGTTAWEAAGTIHSDMQKGFIRAEIISYADFIEAGGETEAKRAGKLRLEMKSYVIQDFDLANFRFSK